MKSFEQYHRTPEENFSDIETYELYIERIKKGELYLSKYARELAERYGFPNDQLEKAIEEGSKKIKQRIIEEYEIFSPRISS